MSDEYFDHEDPDNFSRGEKPAASPIEIPTDAVSVDALDGLIEAFVLREGTDYGSNEISLDVKKRQVADQLKRKEVRIIFDPDSESVTLMSVRDWNKLSKR